MVLDHLLTGGAGLGLAGPADVLAPVHEPAVPSWVAALGLIVLSQLVLGALEAGTGGLAARPTGGLAVAGTERPGQR